MLVHTGMTSVYPTESCECGGVESSTVFLIMSVVIQTSLYGAVTCLNLRHLSENWST